MDNASILLSKRNHQDRRSSDGRKLEGPINSGSLYLVEMGSGRSNLSMPLANTCASKAIAFKIQVSYR